MPDIHVPHLDDPDDHEQPEEGAAPLGAAAPAAAAAPPKPRGRSLLRIALEVALISTGVFLGLAGEQWREHARHRELAEASLRRFRTEILANRKAVLAVKEYHTTTLKSVEAYLAADAKARETLSVHMTGLQPANIEHTAWDLALATQSLADIDPQLGFSLARIYTSQQRYADLTHGILQAMYLRPPSENLDAFFRSMSLYYDDVVIYEPALVAMYDEILPQIDRALGP